MVLNSLLVVKKLERVGDQAKNVFDLADEGVRFTGDPDGEELAALGIEDSGRLGEAASILAAEDEAGAEAFMTACVERTDSQHRRVHKPIPSHDHTHHDLPQPLYYKHTTPTQPTPNTHGRPHRHT